MTTIQQLLKQACEDHGGVSFRNDYSGRGMYGKTCVGIAGDNGDIYSVIAQVIKDAPVNCGSDFNFGNLVDTLLVQSNEDSMGLGMILYWTCLKPIEEDDPNEEWGTIRIRECSE